MTFKKIIEYSNYYGGKLKEIWGKKTAKIFKSSKLNDRNGKLDKTKLQDFRVPKHL